MRVRFPSEAPWPGLLIGIGTQIFNLCNAGSNPVRATILRSSNGRTSDSDSANGGSNPSRRSSLLPLRLVGRAPDFDSGRVGSNPTGASSFINQVKEVYYE